MTECAHNTLHRIWMDETEQYVCHMCGEIFHPPKVYEITSSFVVCWQDECTKTNNLTCCIVCGDPFCPDHRTTDGMCLKCWDIEHEDEHFEEYPDGVK